MSGGSSAPVGRPDRSWRPRHRRWSLGVSGGSTSPSTAHVNPTSGSPGTPSTPPPKGPATLAFPSNHTGGFASIDPRHADDTPQSSAYGSNSPKPPTKTSHTTRTTGQGCRTRPTPPHHLRHRQQPHPLKHPKHPMSPRFHRGGLHFKQPRGGFCVHRPPTRRRHAAKQRLW